MKSNGRNHDAAHVGSVHIREHYAMKRIIFAALVGVLVSGPAWMGSASADEIKNFEYFQNNFKGPEKTTFHVRCFQNGKKIIDAKDLRLRKIKGNLTVGKEFVDQSGRQVVLFISRDTSCLVQETGPKPFMGLPMADPKSK